jgi:hypothetical protein
MFRGVLIVIFVLCTACASSMASLSPSPNPSSNPPQQESPSSCKSTPSFTIAADNTGHIAKGGTVVFTASAAGNGTLPSSLQWYASDAADSTETFTVTLLGQNQAEITLSDVPSSKRLNIIACDASQLSVGDPCDPRHAAAGITLKVVDQPTGIVVIPVIGFEQLGASAASSTQKFFFDFFISRPLPLFAGKDPDPIYGPPWRLWGDVRIGSYPQQITSGVGQFGSTFAASVANLPVNQLAQSGEFNLGLERRMTAFPYPFSSLDSDSNERVTLNLVAGLGGISPLNPTESQNVQIFQNPAAGSPQAAAFFQRFPGSVGSTFTAFTTPDRQQFFWEYGAGVRLMVPFFDKSNVQSGGPAMLTYILGQNQQVSGGISRGVVQRVEGFFPLPLGPRFGLASNSIYLFGRADMRIEPPGQSTPLILQPAPSTVNAFDPNVSVIAVRSNRDTYTIGVGFDAIQIIRTIAGQTQSAKSKTTRKK